MLGPFATASRRTPPVLILHCHSPGVATVARRHCCTPPAHRCSQQQQQRQQRQRVTEGTAMATQNGPNYRWWLCGILVRDSVQLKAVVKHRLRGLIARRKEEQFARRVFYLKCIGDRCTRLPNSVPVRRDNVVFGC